MKEFEPLDILQEECAEVIQSISKIRRFGWECYNPLVPLEFRKLNRDHLIEEIGDVLAVIDLVQHVYNLDPLLIQHAKERKIEKLKMWSTIYSEDQKNFDEPSLGYDAQKSTSIWKWPKFGAFSHLFWR